MKPGDYVRTKRGPFDRFITSHTQDNLTWYTFEDRGDITNPEHYIIKSSPNIIDLIEVGDYVNGGKVYEIKTTEDYVVINADYGKLFEFMNIYEKDIKSIVTREQFSQMEYKVKE